MFSFRLYYFIFMLTIVLIFIVFNSTFLPLCFPAFVRCMPIRLTYMELRTEHFIHFRLIYAFNFTAMSSDDLCNFYFRTGCDYSSCLQWVHLNKTSLRDWNQNFYITEITKMCLKTWDNMWRIWIVKPNLSADVKNIIIIIKKYIKWICIQKLHAANSKDSRFLTGICDIYLSICAW